VIAATQFLSALSQAGLLALVGVPCSSMASVYQALAVDARFRYVPAPNEGAAFAMAAGLHLAGGKPAVLIQNSGFGNLTNPLTSLAMPYRIPVLTFMTVRGGPAAGVDEAEHAVMGQRGTALLDALGLRHHVLSPDPGALHTTVALAQRDMARGEPVFVLIPAGVIAPPVPVQPGPAQPGPAGTTEAGAADELSRGEAIDILVEALPDALFVTSVGYISRELFARADRPENFYLQGAMGHTVSVAAGVAVAHPAQRVVAIEGDGSALMHLGAFSLVGHLSTRNLVHVVLDNGVHESTGGQPTTAATTSFTGVASACGYPVVLTAASAAQLRAARCELAGPGPVLAHVRIAARSAKPGGRATEAISGPDMAARFAVAIRERETPP
jgi:phosphonopyruvate decarboxylase